MVDPIRIIGGWPKDRKCADMSPSDFFRDDGGYAIPVETLEICDSCPARNLCAEFAIENEEPFGVWGGLITSELRRIISARSSRLFRNKALLYHNAVPTCRTRVGPTAKGYRTHIDNGQLPCSECRIAYRKQQKSAEERKSEKPLAQKR